MQTEYKQQELFNTTEIRHELYRVLPHGICFAFGRDFENEFVNLTLNFI